jgi:hypothetical protein
MKGSQHLTDRGAVARRKTQLLKGETDRKRIGIWLRAAKSGSLRCDVRQWSWVAFGATILLTGVIGEGSAIDPGCAKTPVSNLLVESSSQFGESETKMLATAIQ